ncbi:hypothetical protein [Actinospongicola halichondriae]|uniref:hypothetical protein n=1 Tax=Actinospongicola halichondriae TaxID=3236844 RepID=UPI003D42B72A
MGFLDRFKKGDGEANEPAAVVPDRWDGSAIDWSAAGVPDDAVDLATEIAATPDFGVDPSDEDGFRWLVALFDDVRGLVGDPAIEALPAWLESSPDVDRAESFDRELVHVSGTVERHELAVRVVSRLAATADPTYWDDATP